tara:strand:+ start:1434 stop:2438 length:1005 start_codon:yes stop_codon:yes gene_type:complete
MLRSQKQRKYKRIKTKEMFIERSRAKHADKYDYSKVEFPDRGHAPVSGRKLANYDGNTTVTISCPKHGDYTQRPRKHLEGSGCRKCAYEAIALAQAGRPSTIVHKRRYFDKRLTVPADLQQDLKQQLAEIQKAKSRCSTYVFTIDSPTHGVVEVLIDKEDWPKVSAHTWFATKAHPGRNGEKQFYVSARVAAPHLPRLEYTHPRTGKRRTYQRCTHLALGRLIVDAPADKLVDHIDGNTLDNRKHNLRVCSYTENNQNTRTKRNTTSRFKGVNRNKNKKYNCWSAYIRLEGKTVNLGSYATEEDAARAYDIMHLTKSGIYAKTNFPIEEYIGIC